MVLQRFYVESGGDSGFISIHILEHYVTLVHQTTSMYFPWHGSHLIIMDEGLKALLVISATESIPW